MESALASIFRNLSRYFSTYKVVSGEEMLCAIEAEVDKLSEETVKGLEEWLKGNLEEVIFQSIVSEPVSIYSPNMTGKRNYLGEIFYLQPIHTYRMEELEQAFDRLVKLRAPVILPRMEAATNNFLTKGGYDVIGCLDKQEVIQHKEMMAAKGEYKLYLYLIPSIVSVTEFDLSAERVADQVMVVPTEKTPAPFINFARDYLGDFAGKVQIWVADVDQEVINPFLGGPKDKELDKKFGSPELAYLAARIFQSQRLSQLSEED